MHLIVDAAGNRISLGDLTVQGRHRWEAAVLSHLLAACNGNAAGVRRCDDLDVVLMQMGQAQPLQRRQWARVIDGLRDCFQRLGPCALEAFDRRFGHAPRQRTVGPWWWKPEPGDHWQLSAHTPAAGLEAPPEVELPRLSSDADHAETVRLCRQALVAMGLGREGLRREALEMLLHDDLAWRGASPELHALRLLRGAEAAMSTGAFDMALSALDEAEALTQSSLVANRLLANSLLGARLQCLYSRNPGAHFDQLLEKGRQLSVHTPVAQLAPADADVWNLMSLCERRWYDRRALLAPQAERDRHFRQALAWSHGALMIALAQGDAARAQRYCASTAYLCQRAEALQGAEGLSRAMDWYALAHAYQQRFELPLSATWEFIFIGELWLGSPGLRAHFHEHVHRCVWHNQRPDEIAFYLTGLSVAESLGDPRQVARNALNLYAFAELTGAGAEADRAVKLLTALLKQHKELRALLVSEGCEFPAPLRRRRPREPVVV